MHRLAIDPDVPIDAVDGQGIPAVGAGSDGPGLDVESVHDLAAIARTEWDAYTRQVSDGERRRSTGTLFADVIAVSAIDAEGRDLRAIVPTDRAGVELFDDWMVSGNA